MRVSVAFLVSAGFVAITAGVAYWAWISLPPGAGIPTNILGFDGVRRAGSSRALIWLLPFVSAVVTFALNFGPSRRPGTEAAAQPYETTMIALAGLMLIVETALIGRAADPAFNVMRPVAIATGVLLLAIGNYLGKTRQNPVFGIKTPWTLANAAVWDKTHRFTGRAMFLGGALLVALGFVLHDGNALGLSIALCAAVPPITGLVWSRRLARQA